MVNCRIENKFYGCFLYADDIISLSPSVGSLQNMLNTCVITCERIRLKFNPDKSACIVFNRKISHDISSMILGNFCIHWSESVRYLGVYIIGNRELSFSMPHLIISDHTLNP